MIFPHTITIYNKTAAGTYARYILTGVYWYGGTKAAVSGNGRQLTEGITVVIPKVKLNEYAEVYTAGKFSLAKGDRIVKGSQTLEIEKWADLKDLSPITIGGVTDYQCQSGLDCIEVVSA